eukprot:CAMPEP_0194215708 /NCGR_PEP_ID=MMETSP0156-20130528/17704_1 /TAXON_ID=33649 /ORGANISM="Thalassionema nitzschioides, Strain L26-B" /LENGTH=635 /DNA_ID=CAMNT_0038944305 /DNA_START=288 /DNA_END=2195 /DNA_ORIENTATION=-
MSHHGYNPHHQTSQIVVHDHDVLSGRGVNIAHHPGNQRFRSLVTTRTDEAYCASYSASEKKAVAEEIIRHIKELNPPGRFLKREGRGQVSRGLQGPWEMLTEKEVIKKACQALRDCNRLDRQGYANGVAMPNDVVHSARKRDESGLTGKQRAARAAAEAAAAKAAATISDSTTNLSKRDWGRVSPSVENAAEWLKKQRTDEANAPAIATPSTSGSDTIINNAGPNVPHVPYDPVAYDPIAAPRPHYTSEHPTYPYRSIGGALYPPSALASTASGTYSHHGPPREYPVVVEGQVSFVSTSSNEAYSPTLAAPQQAPYHSAAPTATTVTQPIQASGPGISDRQMPATVYSPSPLPPYALAPSYPSTNSSVPVNNGAAAYHPGATVYQQPLSTGYSTAPSTNSYTPTPGQGRSFPASGVSTQIVQAHVVPAPSPIFGSASPVTAYAPPGQASIPYHPVAGPVPTYQPVDPQQRGQHMQVEQTSSVTGSTVVPTSQLSSFSHVPNDLAVPQTGDHTHSPAPGGFPGAQTPSLTLTSNEQLHQPDRRALFSTTAPAHAAPLAKYATSTEYQSIGNPHSANNSEAAPASISEPAYEQGDLHAPSAGADLLISAANQSTAASSDALTEAATKWDGEAEALGL